jgi:hypothetical protein
MDGEIDPAVPIFVAAAKSATLNANHNPLKCSLVWVVFMAANLEIYEISSGKNLLISWL